MRGNKSKPSLFWRAIEWSAVLVGLTWFVTWGLAHEQRQRWSRLRHRSLAPPSRAVPLDAAGVARRSP